jgi:hypothetical protein
MSGFKKEKHHSKYISQFLDIEPILRHVMETEFDIHLNDSFYDTD